MGKSKYTQKKNVAAKSNKSANTVTEEATSSVAVPLNTANLQLCRLCEIDLGPFLNIFDSTNKMEEKIAHLLPFVVSFSLFINFCVTSFLIWFSYPSILYLLISTPSNCLRLQRLRRINLKPATIICCEFYVIEYSITCYAGFMKNSEQL